MARCCSNPEGRAEFRFSAVARGIFACTLHWMVLSLLLAVATAAQSSPAVPQGAPSIPECEPVGQQIPHGDALRGVCQYAATLPQRMPNFTCEQKTSRYINDQAADVITAKVTYSDGKESYRDIKSIGHPLNEAVLQKAGTWSTGQFESDVRAIFVGANKVTWQFAGEEKVGARSALVFQYQIAHQDEPLWQLHMNGLVAAPPYKGKLWIEEETAVPIRLDIAATELPIDFPLTSADVQIDYGDVQFGDGSSFVLPVKSVVNSSARAGRTSRNVLQFQDCHKFRATARIVAPAN